MAYTPLVDPDESLELPSTPGQGLRQAKRELLAHIIHQRLDEIFGFVQQEVDEAGFGSVLPAGVVLTGGGAQLPGIVELAREVFALPARAGAPTRGLTGLVDNVNAPRFAVPAGLVMYAAQESIRSAEVSSLGVNKLLDPVKRWFQDMTW